jgi:hypothetical protein
MPPSDRPQSPDAIPPERTNPETQEPLVADPRFQKRAGNLQLEDIKKRVNDKVLKRANMTEQEYQDFLKAMEALRKRNPPGAADREKLADPSLGNRGSRNQGLRRVEPGKAGKPEDLQRAGPAQPPPEFQESFKKFSRALNELGFSPDKKGND